MVCHLDEIPLPPDIIIKKAGMTLDKSTAYLMFDMMATDGYLKREKENAAYIILYKGVLFYENGGYEIQHRHYKRQKLAQFISDYVDIVVKPIGIITALLVTCWTIIQILKFFGILHSTT